MKLNSLLATSAAAALVATSAMAEITIGASLPLTGAFSVSGSKHEKGYQLCVDLINERGGINGEQLPKVDGTHGVVVGDQRGPLRRLGDRGR